MQPGSFIVRSSGSLSGLAPPRSCWLPWPQICSDPTTKQLRKRRWMPLLPGSRRKSCATDSLHARAMEIRSRRWHRILAGRPRPSMPFKSVSASINSSTAKSKWTVQTDWSARGQSRSSPNVSSTVSKRLVDSSFWVSCGPRLSLHGVSRVTLSRCWATQWGRSATMGDGATGLEGKKARAPAISLVPAGGEAGAGRTRR